MEDAHIIQAEALAQNEDILPEEIAMLLDSNTPPDNSQKKKVPKDKKNTKKQKGTKNKKSTSDNDIEKDMENALKNHTSEVEKFDVGDNIIYVKMREGKIVDRFDDGSGTVDYTIELINENSVISTTGTKYLIIEKDGDKKNGKVKYTKCLGGTVVKVLDNDTYIVKLSNTFELCVSGIDIMRPDDYNMFSQDQEE